MTRAYYGIMPTGNCRFRVVPFSNDLLEVQVQDIVVRSVHRARKKAEPPPEQARADYDIMPHINVRFRGGPFYGPC